MPVDYRKIVDDAIKEAAAPPSATLVWGNRGRAPFNVSPVDDDGAGLIAGTDCPWFKGLVNFTYRESDDQIVATGADGAELGRTKLGSPDSFFLVLVGRAVGIPLYYQWLLHDGAVVLGPDKAAVRERAAELNQQLQGPPVDSDGDDDFDPDQERIEHLQPSATNKQAKILELQAAGHGRVYGAKCGHLIRQCRCSRHVIEGLGLKLADLDRTVDDWCTACKDARSSRTA